MSHIGTTVWFSGGKGLKEGYEIIYNTLSKLGASSFYNFHGKNFSYKKCGGERVRLNIEDFGNLRDAILFDVSFKIDYASPLNNAVEKTSIISVQFEAEDTYPFLKPKRKNKWMMCCDELELLPLVIDDHRRAMTEEEFKSYYETVNVYYNLIKYLHIQLESTLTAAVENRQNICFGEDPGTHWGFDSLLRFDSNEHCKLMKPYEEGREIIYPQDMKLHSVDDMGHSIGSWVDYSETPVEIKVPDDFLRLIGEL